MLSHQLWVRRFHADPGIVGTANRTNDEIRTVVGVMPEGFAFPLNSDVAALMSFAPEETEFWAPFQHTQREVERGTFNYLVVGRVAPGLTNAQAEARLTALSHQYFE